MVTEVVVCTRCGRTIVLMTSMNLTRKQREEYICPNCRKEINESSDL